MSIENAFQQFINLVSAHPPLPPDAGALGDYRPVLTAVTRDKRGIICQRQDTTDIACQVLADGLDGGDSSHRTGIAAFCGSPPDAELLPLFEADGLARRHPGPEQHPWDRPENFTRDQLMAYTAGCWRAGLTDINLRLLERHRSRGFLCQNTDSDCEGSGKPPYEIDVLWPDDQMALEICTGNSIKYTDAFAQFWLQNQIQFGNSENEQNQIILKCIICGRLDYYVRRYPDYRDLIRRYWDGSQPQIGEALIEIIEVEMKRYRAINRDLDWLLPDHVLAFLQETDWKRELTSLNPLKFQDLSTRFAIATLKDAVEFLIGAGSLTTQAAGEALKALGAPLKIASQVLIAHGFRQTEVDAVISSLFGDDEKPPPPPPRRRFSSVLPLIGAVGAREIGVRL